MYRFNKEELLIIFDALSKTISVQQIFPNGTDAQEHRVKILTKVGEQIDELTALENAPVAQFEPDFEPGEP